MPISTNKPDETEPKTGSIGHTAARGAMWVASASVVAVLLGYCRNWILSRIGIQGEVIGTYALVLLFTQIIVTFVIFGGTSAVTNFLPKISNRKDKANFLLAYSCISALTTTIFLAIILIWPETLSSLMRRQVAGATLTALAVLTPIILFSQLTLFSLAGLMAFRSSATLAQLQLFLVTLTASLGYLFFEKFFAEHSLVILAGTVAIANAVVILIGGTKIIRTIKLPGVFYLPTNFWGFTGFVHLCTILTFLYLYMDQIFVVTKIGVGVLGVYFIMSECARLITFVPQRISQVMLASFAHLVGRAQHEQLKAGYSKLCRIIIIFSTIVAMALVLFSRQIGNIFGELYGSRHLYLILLAWAANIGCIGSVNAMLVMSKERTGYYLTNSLILVGLQLVVTFALIDIIGVYGVIIGKIVGRISGQIGLFAIVRWRLSEIRLAPPREYWISQMFMTSIAAYAWYIDGNHPSWAVALLGFAAGLFLIIVRFRPREVTTLLLNR